MPPLSGCWNPDATSLPTKSTDRVPSPETKFEEKEECAGQGQASADSQVMTQAPVFRDGVPMPPFAVIKVKWLPHKVTAW